MAEGNTSAVVRKRLSLFSNMSSAANTDTVGTPTSSRCGLSAIREEKENTSSGKRILASKSPRKNLPPLGLTPLRPEKSPRRKLAPSGLTPIRPESASKRRKTGLVPIRPGNLDQSLINANGGDVSLNGTLIRNQRRKTGIVPIRPGGSSGLLVSIHDGQYGTKTNGALPSSSRKVKVNNISLPVGRRKTGILPIRPLIKAEPVQPAANSNVPKFNASISEASFNFGNFGPSRQLAFSGSRPVQKVDREVEKQLRFDESGIDALDETTVTIVDTLKRSINLNMSANNRTAPKSGPSTSKIPVKDRPALNPNTAAKRSILKEMESSNQLTKQVKSSSKKRVQLSGITASAPPEKITEQRKSETVEAVTQTKDLFPPRKLSHITETDEATASAAGPSTEDENLDALLKKKSLLESELALVSEKIRTLQIQQGLRRLDLEDDFEQFEDDSESLPRNFEMASFVHPSNNPDVIYKEYRTVCSFLETPKPLKGKPAPPPDTSNPVEQTPGLRGRFRAQLADLFE